MSSQEDAAATTAGAANAGPAPTPKEAAFFLAILNNMKNKPEVSHLTSFPSIDTFSSSSLLKLE